ncbi:hypothetical protein [Pendulispora albinea]|uniref:Uncharacterized protein n=1 Tax=Pendulispora albinea TaxID=2741071 RepID=A0ABZ2LZY7_9BACT
MVRCDDRRAPFFYDGPACAQIVGMSFDIHRDNWASNYLNYDDPSDPSNAGLLTHQRYISLQLADPTAYKALGLLKAYQVTGQRAFLERFRRDFLQSILDKQLPSGPLNLGAVHTFQAAFAPDPQRDVTLDATGGFANSATLDAGADTTLGTSDDVLTWRWNGHAGFNFAALAEVLLLYVQITGDARVLPAVDRAGRFLVRLEHRDLSGQGDGSWSYGVAPANGYPDRMTTAILGLTAWRLSKLGTLPNAAQFRAAANRAAAWLEKQSASGIDVVAAGAEIQLRVAAGQTAGAAKVADALLARMTTPANVAWGDHRYAQDAHALGGIASPWSTGSFQSPWFATYNVAGLLELSRATGDAHYTDAAALLVRWLGDKVTIAQRDRGDVVVQDLRGGLAHIRGGSYWGLLPETYEPNAGTYVDSTGAVLPTVPNSILGWIATPPIPLTLRPNSWLEQRTGIDFERLLAQHVQYDSYYAHISQVYPWNGWTSTPHDLGEVAPSINPLLADDAALALLDFAGRN